jgi:hypothetical protein
MQIRKQYFDTFSCINTSPIDEVGGTSILISRRCACCGKFETVIRKHFDNAENACNFAIRETETLNRHSVTMFLWYRPRILNLVFNLADTHGLILTRGLVKAGLKMNAPVFKNFPKISDNRFIAICKILTRYGVLHEISEEIFCSYIRGPF